MGATREGEKVDIFTTTQRTRYGQVGQGVNEEGKAKFIAVDEQGRTKILIDGTVSTLNSTDIVLAAGSSFTGGIEDITDVAAIFVNVFADQDSADEGLSIQQSSNGINWDHTDEYDIFTDTGKNYNINPNSQYFRIIYTNGATTQTAFRLQTIFKNNYGSPSSHRLGSTIKTDDDSQLVKSVIAVQTNDTKVYQNVDVQNPIPADGDSVYGKDLIIDLSDVGDFTIPTEPGASKTRILTSMVSNVEVEKENSTATNPKLVTLTFARPVSTNGFGIDSGPNGDFSNVKIYVFQGTEEILVVDESADSTKHKIRLFSITPLRFSKMRIEFHTADTVTTGLFGIFKSIDTASRIQAVSELTETVENVASFRNALKVDTALVHKEGVNLFFFRETGVGSTLAVAASQNDTSITVVDSTGFNVGDRLKLTSTIATGQPFLFITNIATNVIILDRPLVVDLSIGDAADIVTTDLNVVGSLASPVIFNIAPPNGGLALIWQLTRMMISITDATSMDDGKFGGIPGLTNGVVLRIVKGDGTIQELTTWKTNGDMALDMYDVTYTDKAPAGSFGLRARWTFTKAEFIVELDGEAGDVFQVLIQDDLTDNTGYEMKGQGRLFGA